MKNTTFPAPKSAKRLSSQAEITDVQPNEKKMRPTSSFASVIGEVMMVRSFQGFCNSLEPLLRRVVHEEVERGLQRKMRTMTRSPSFRIQAPEPASLRLIFTNINLPTIFTCNKILDINREPLQLMLVEKIGDQITPKILPFPIKIEIVAIDGDFPASSDRDTWTVDEFNRNIIKERAGRRPLLTKEVNYTIKNNNTITLGELEFTDNSSWIRSRKFRLGARIVASDGSNNVRILEALTEAFVVKDHRGELYKKHYPPMLDDEVWRLEKISKEGKFHERLEQAGIYTVQHFLKLSVINPSKLKMILGSKSEISEKMWETILKHARTCNTGNKLYICSGPNFTVFLDAICQIVTIKKIHGHHHYSNQDYSTSLKIEIDQLVMNAYKNWDSLQVVERPVNEIIQGNVLAECCNEQESAMPYDLVIGGAIGVGSTQPTNDNNMQIEYGDWETLPIIFN